MHDDYPDAEALARIAALEAQLLAAQKANTDLINRIVRAEHERDAAFELVEGYARLINDTLLSAPRMQLDSVSSFPPPPPMPAEDALSSVASQLAVMIIQERLAAGHPITFASDLTPSTQEGGDDE